MQIFDFVNDILYHKSGTKMDNIDDETQFVPYMVNRWISMHSPEYAVMINETGNKLYPAIFPTKKNYYSFLVNVLPAAPRTRIDYIKKVKKDKPKKEKKPDIDMVELIASSLELSKREVQAYLDQQGTPEHWCKIE